MRLLVLVMTALMILAFSAATASGRDIFVNNAAGDDRFVGQQAGSVAGGQGPVRSINRALSLVQPGDRVVLANTGLPYRECVSVAGSRRSRFVSGPFQLVGNGAILDGSAPVPAEAWEHYQDAVFRFQPPHTVYQQLFLDGRPILPVVSNPMSDAPAKLNRLEWTLHRAWAYFCVERTKLPPAYPLSFAYLQTGITLFHVEGVEIRDLVVQGFHLDGLNAFNSARDVALVRVTSRGNGRAGVSVGGASRVSLEGCLVGDNGFAQVLTHAWSETYLRDTEIIANTAPAWVDQGGRLYRHGEPGP